MWFFKEKVVKKIPDNACWGLLVSLHKVDVNTLSQIMRCVTKKGIVDRENVTFLRIFNRQETAQRNITVTGWETFDEHPGLIAFEGYVTDVTNRAVLERKNF